MGDCAGAGGGVSTDSEGVSGGGAADDGGFVVQTGVWMRVRGCGERGVRFGGGGAGGDGRGGAARDIAAPGAGMWDTHEDGLFYRAGSGEELGFHRSEERRVGKECR